jgi:hypothetical protein
VTLHATCPLCGVRKAKRDCPALGKRICAVCCATKRLTEINCPESCTYLASARTHPAAVVQRRHDRDVAFLLPLISDLGEPKVSLMFLFCSVTRGHAAQAIPPLLDADVAEAADAVAATLETARKGVIYQHEPASIPAQRLAAVFRETIGALKSEAGSRVSRLEADVVAVLRVIERGARTAKDSLAGDEAPVFINLLKRLPGADPESGGSLSLDVTPDRGPLIIPG